MSRTNETRHIDIYVLLLFILLLFIYLLFDKYNKSTNDETLNVIPLDVIPLNDYEKVCSSCTVYIVLFAIFFITSIDISSVFISFYWYFRKDNISANFIVGYLNI